MPEDEKVLLTPEQAIKLLGDREQIHTFRNSTGMMLGADHGRESLIRTINKAEGIEIGGPACKSMGHGLIVWDDGPLFVEVDTKELEKLEPVTK